MSSNTFDSLQLSQPTAQGVAEMNFSHMTEVQVGLGCWVLGLGFCVLGVGCWVLGFVCCVLCVERQAL